MKITNKEALEKFTVNHADSLKPVGKWVEIVENTEFKNHNELKNIFPHADYVGNQRYVFNLKGNHYRLVVLVIFFNGVMDIRFCGTHAEYDKIKNIQNI